MADPTPYQISYSFSGWQASYPSKPLPAANVDNELANIQTAIASLVASVKDVRRSDGTLPNGIVGFQTLDNDLRAGFSGGAVSAWAPIVDFASGIAAQVVAPATTVYYGGETYVCVVAHTTTSIFVPSNWKKVAAKGANGSGSGDMLAANNLADVASLSQALTNLGGLSKTGNLADVVDAVAALANLGGVSKAANLSDIANAATALANLGGLKASNNLSDIGNAATALRNLGGVTLTQGTQQNASGLSAVDFTVPTYAKRVTVCFNGLSLIGTNDILVQIGPSAGVETTGYTSGSSGVASSGAGFVMRSNLNTRAAVGTMTLVNMSGNIWTSTHTIYGDATAVFTGAGVKGISGVLNTLRVTRTGVETFDGGTVNIVYE